MEPSNNDVLRALILRHGLTRAQVAELIGVSRITVDSWLRSPTSRAYRGMPDPMLELLRLKLSRRKKRT